MRLLECKDSGDFSLTNDFLDDIPRYAILSHTWGPDTEEVTFKDLIDGTGKSKVGYNKIRFCGEQARKDGIQYIWVDTCCIDKSNNTELSEAINSMFRWYHEAEKCYVYLSDVPRPSFDTDVESYQPWESTFRRSRWFTRGWTLQELIAPKLIEFFSKDWGKLGNMTFLEQHICEITRIPVKALRGSTLSDFSITERMSWAETRQTTRNEDKAYSLLGIFNIHMPLIYGEGEKEAFQRLRETIDRSLKGPKHEDFSVPFSLSDVPIIEHFIGREGELTEIHGTLSGDGSRNTVILHGLGGIGKTQLSITYAKRHKDNYSAIFWLNIKDEDSLKQSFTQVAKQIARKHPSALLLNNLDMKENRDEVVDAVKAWLSLSNNTRWLMIYDNYDNPKLASNKDPKALDIRKFLPESHQGSIIITTRSPQVKIGHRIQISKLKNVQDSLEILSTTSGRGRSQLNPDAIRLAKKLDGLPLALATAGAYLDQASISFSDYLRLYEESWATLQKTSPELISYEDRTLYSTWQISFDHVEQQNRLSAQLLRLWAYFDNQDLWFELFQHSDLKGLDWIQELAKDEISFHGAVRVLSNHGLVEVDSSSQEMIESRGYSIHGCVHSWTIHVLNQDWDYNLAREAIKFVALHVPREEAIKPWLIKRRLLQHATRCSYMVLNGLVRDDEIEWAYHNLGLLYMDLGKLEEAEKMYQWALQGHEKVWGPEHTLTLGTVNNLGVLYTDWGKLEEAEKMYQRALQGYEKAWGPEHTSTLNTINNLGALYADLDRLEEAEKMHQRALQGYEKVWGPEHTSTLNTVNNLGVLYKSLGKLEEAEKMYQWALQGYEKVWGPEHTSTLVTVNNLGMLYADLGKLEEAEKMYQWALQGHEKTWGPEHTLTLDTVNNLGALYKSLGKLEEAEKMYWRALQGKEKAWGLEHTSTLDTVNNLGMLYADLGKLAEAEKMYQRALKGYEKALGTDNMTIYIPALNTVGNLGTLFERHGDIRKARIMYLKALGGYETVVGADHPRSQSLQGKLHALDDVMGTSLL